MENWPLDPAAFDWSSDDSERSARRLLLAATREAALASYDEAVESFTAFTARAPELNTTLRAVLLECEWPADSLLSSVSIKGIVETGNKPHAWLIFSKENSSERDFDVLKIDLGNRCIQQDGWTLLATDPLLFVSLYGAVVGFRKADAMIHEILVVDGHSGWD